EELIATKPIELDQDFLEKAGENGGIVLAIDGVQPGDIIEFRRGRYSVVGMHCYGKQAVIRNGEKKMDVSVKKVRLVRYGKGLRFQSRFLLTGGVSSGGIR
ncbi:MAG: hypothetical protein M1476_00555, partial [Candidatus Thermoplasmatota archaeon]|nr:hypothetical protein [Candidatus Thermoplasmatota archaeon]